MKNYIISHITRILLSLLRKSRNGDNKLLAITNDFIGDEIISYGLYERQELNTIRKVLDFDTTQNTALDIGANIGNHAVQLGTFFESVLCYEPNPTLFKVLEINTSHLPNIKAFNYGLSHVESLGHLEVYKDNYGKSSVIQEPNHHSISIQLRLGDNSIKESFSFIKMDVEGHENSVVEGMSELIRKNKPIICFELINQNTDDLILLETLKNLGYQYFYIPYRKSIFPKKWRKSFYTSFVDGLFFKPTYQLKSIKEFDQDFYSLVFCEQEGSEFRIKKSSIVE